MIKDDGKGLLERVCVMCGLFGTLTSPRVPLRLSWTPGASCHRECWPGYGPAEDQPRAEIVSDLEEIVTWVKKTSSRA